MTSRYHPYRHRRPRYRGRRHYAKILLRWPRTPLDRALDRALDIELQGMTNDMIAGIKSQISQIADVFHVLEELQRTHPSPRTATAAAILERDHHLRQTRPQ